MSLLRLIMSGVLASDGAMEPPSLDGAIGAIVGWCDGSLHRLMRLEPPSSDGAMEPPSLDGVIGAAVG